MKQFVAREHEIEPVPGLPGHLPTGEKMLWQGRPSASLVARHVLKSRWIAGYFVLLILWAAYAGFNDGHSLGGIAFSVAVLTALAGCLIALIELFAWAVQKTTLYTITSERIVMRIGVALSVTLNLPYRQVNAVALGKLGGKAGTVAIELLPGHRLSWLMQWPHARGWHFTNVQPSLICLSDADKVCDILALAMVQSRNLHSGHARLVVGEARPVAVREPALVAAQ